MGENGKMMYGRIASVCALDAVCDWVICFPEGSIFSRGVEVVEHAAEVDEDDAGPLSFRVSLL